MNSKWSLGIYAGLLGGSVFGVMMASAGMYPMISMMIGMENAIVGFVIHLIISALSGAVFALALDNMVMQGPGMSLGVGAVYGIVWWVLGPLLIMPAVLGMPLFAVEAQTGSLFGHVIFGITLGVTYWIMRKLSASS